MKVEMIFVGTELLLGNILNTNAKYLSEQCAALGCDVYYQTVVGDNDGRLTELLGQAMSRSEIVIMSGGLGPTEDDMTKETAAKAVGAALVEDKEARERIEAYFASHPDRIPVNNWKQALVPEGSIVLQNDNGTAPGIIIEHENCAIILLPGPPGELIPLFENGVRPYIEKRTGGTIYSETVKVAGVGESQAELDILDMIDAQTNPTIATYAKTAEVHIRVTAKAQDKESAKALVAPVRDELCRRFGNAVYTTDENIDLEEAIVTLLKEKKMTVAFAESCTGGMLSARLVNASGASEVLKGSLITYTEEAKQKLAGVPEEIIRDYGVVSEECARAMATGTRERMGVDAAVSVTGIAGPDGGTPEKPVGLVYIACDFRGNVKVEKYRFRGNRLKIRDFATARALNLLRLSVIEG